MKFREHIIAMEAEIDRIKAKPKGQRNLDGNLCAEDEARIRDLKKQILKGKTWLAGIGGLYE